MICAGRDPEKLTRGMRVFAAMLAFLLISAGIYAIYSGFSEDTPLIAAGGVAVIVYGLLWGNLARTGRHGKVPLWP
ncbi:MAG: hypothetical protein KF881_02285 [Acidobacteria bacterium]|nr:hypothetical protein [Acidobacteriota bacterium]